MNAPPTSDSTYQAVKMKATIDQWQGTRRQEETFDIKSQEELKSMTPKDRDAAATRFKGTYRINSSWKN